MENPIKLTEKYDSIKRPDIKSPAGWNLSLLTSLEWIRFHALLSPGEIAYTKECETLSDRGIPGFCIFFLFG